MSAPRTKSEFHAMRDRIDRSLREANEAVSRVNRNSTDSELRPYKERRGKLQSEWDNFMNSYDHLYPTLPN